MFAKVLDKNWTHWATNLCKLLSLLGGHFYLCGILFGNQSHSSISHCNICNLQYVAKQELNDILLIEALLQLLQKLYSSAVDTQKH